MQNKHKNRALLIFKYLMAHTDQGHQKSTQDIQEYLSGFGISAGQKTIAADIEQLQEAGYDVICNKSRQNMYFIGERDFELPELKMLVDAVQAARFISKRKSGQLIRKLTALASPYEAKELKRQLYVEGRVKTSNEQVFYAVDLLYAAINENKQITFQYYEYGPDKKKTLKHKGQQYAFSPYDLVWSNDSYYVCGFSERHGKTATFRVDRMHRPAITERAAVPKPPDYDIAAICRQAFMMYDAGTVTVKLYCENDMMKAIIDRFGEQVQTDWSDTGHFTATVTVSSGPTFFAWIFNYAGKLRIVSPQGMVDEYKAHLKKAAESA
ncbi:MAG: helix-turn-helix transcriptional regulator [Candidatus Heteroscillospira sp.]